MELTVDRVNSLEINDYIGESLACACGKPHAIAMERILIEPGAVAKTAAVLTELGYKKALLIADEHTWRAAGAQAAAVLDQANFAYHKYVFAAGGDALVPDEAAVGAIFIQADDTIDVIVSIGSGVINDLGKFMSFRLGIDSVVVATAPSMDGFASTGAALIVNHLKTSYECACPKAVIGDVNILKEAPMPMIIAGWSDIIGKYSALSDWQVSAIVNDEFHCEVVAKMVQKSIQTCMDNIEKIRQRDGQAIQNLMEGLVLTGIAMSFVGNSRPASGSEHHLSHYWEMQFLFENKKAILHGTKVGVATTITTRLYELLRNRQPDFAKAAEAAKNFSEKQWQYDVNKYYLECAPAIVAAAEKERRNDCAQRLARLKVIEAKWDELQAVFAHVAPAEKIRAILKEAGAPACPKDIEITTESVMAAVRLAKEVRPRYTVLGLASDLGLLDDFAAQIGLETAE